MFGETIETSLFLSLLLDFRDTPVPSATLTAEKSAGAIPVEHPEGTPEKCAPEKQKKILVSLGRRRRKRGTSIGILVKRA